MLPESAADRLAAVRARIQSACLSARRPRDAVSLLAVGKTWPAAALRALAAAGQRDFGENYVQEALGKMQALADPALRWHLIGPLQSNKCREVAQRFDWLQSLDRAKLVPLLSRHRDPVRPLQVLLQVKVDDEPSKSGARKDEVPGLAEMVADAPGLRLRGLMTIPAPGPMPARRRAFAGLRQLYETLREAHPEVDTLSMGMSEDLEDAIAEGATMVRVGTALFGPRA